MGNMNVSNLKDVIKSPEDGYKALGLAILRMTYIDLNKGPHGKNAGRYISAKRFLNKDFGKFLVEFYGLESKFDKILKGEKVQYGKTRNPALQC